MGVKILDGRIKGPKKQSTFGRAKKPFVGKKRNRKGSLKSSFLVFGVKKRVSKIDREFLSWLHCTSYACMVCGKRNVVLANFQVDYIEWHHVKRDSSDAKDHTRLIPLCGVEHHRLGTVLSAHGTPRKFRAMFSMEFQLEFAAEIYEDYLKEKS